MLFTRKYIVIVIMTIFVAAACSHKLAATKTTPGENATLKVMSYNIHHANPPAKANVIDLDAIAAVIQQAHPDIVGLQEVDKGTKRSGNIDEAALLAQKTNMHYQFFKAIDYDGGEYGLAILSRFPIEKYNKVDLPQAMKGEARILSFINIQLPGKGILVFANTHLDAQRPDSNRVVQVKQILETLNKEKSPVIIVGDFNSEAGRETIQLLDQSFTRSCVKDCAFTIPQINPNKTIDFIAIKNAGWSVVEHIVMPELYASDHRPVTVVYQVK